MLWHIVRFRFPEDVEAQDRQSFEADLAGLAAIEQVRVVRVARDIDEPRVTGLITGFDDAEALAAYRSHPEHVPVLRRARQLCDEITRLDVATGDDPGALPREL